ncbi:DUF645 family protein [Vibrio cholerae]|uniref:DUF645 family protein n=1 Tax=Vibrio cholerae TaxID=666 RepID=UPI0011588D5E|nr:DUF645 family protein [Vibrio cholerae]TQO81233.1 DUF645 family protein [Vibrio cholerae]
MLDVQLGQLGFTKSSIVAEIALSFVGNSVSGQLNLDRCEFWLLSSQLLALDVCLSDAFA